MKRHTHVASAHSPRNRWQYRSQFLKYSFPSMGAIGLGIFAAITLVMQKEVSAITFREILPVLLVVLGGLTLYPYVIDSCRRHVDVVQGTVQRIEDVTPRRYWKPRYDMHLTIADITLVVHDKELAPAIQLGKDYAVHYGRSTKIVVAILDLPESLG